MWLGDGLGSELGNGLGVWVGLVPGSGSEVLAFSMVNACSCSPSAFLASITI
ncbi:hypothetical protein D3C86_2067610 [compost metagenome]